MLKIFVKDYENTEDEKVRARYGSFSGIVGIISNLILVGIKLLVGIISASLSIIADAINNLSDAGSSIVTLVGFKMSSKEADDDHPFGHERIEYLAGFIVSMVILFVGGTLIIESVKKIFNPEETIFDYLTIIILSISIAIKLWQAFFYRTLGNRIDSTTLYATSRDSLNDCVATLAVLISVLITKFTGYNLDAYFGILVSLFIIKSGIDLIKETSSPLIGVLPSKELVDRVLNVVMCDPLILGFHDLVIHSYGPKKFYASCHVEFDYRENVLKIHDLIDNIENECMEKTGVQLVIHMDPIVVDDEETINLKEKVSLLIKEINPEVSFHDFRMVKGETHTNVLFDCVIPYNNEKKTKMLFRERITEEIKRINPKYNVIISFDMRMDYKE